MHIEPSIGIVVLLFGLGGLVVFVKYIRKKIKKQKKLSLKPNDEAIDCSISTDNGKCNIRGYKEQFKIYFENEDIEFFVENGNIKKYKLKNDTNYKEYHF